MGPLLGLLRVPAGLSHGRSGPPTITSTTTPKLIIALSVTVAHAFLIIAMIHLGWSVCFVDYHHQLHPQQLLIQRVASSMPPLTAKFTA